MTKIALIAKPGPELKAVYEQLRNPNLFVVREFLSIDDANRDLAGYSFDILMMRVPAFGAPHVAMLERVRARFPKAGLVTSAAEIEPSARYQVRLVRRHKLIHEPTEIQDLPSIIESLRKGDGSSLRLHPRMKRDGEAELVDPSTGVRMKARFLDFAQMGAKVIVRVREPLTKRARLQLHYRSSHDPNKINKIETMVMWGGMTSGVFESIVAGPQQIVGLRFIAAL